MAKDNEHQDCRNLWSAVMSRAVRDVQDYQVKFQHIENETLKIKKKREADSSRYWLRNKRNIGVGSFVWVCQSLGLDAEKTRRHIFENMGNIIFKDE